MGKKRADGPLYGLILRDKIGTPKETRETILESEPSLGRVRGVVRKIKPRLNRKIILVKDGKEMAPSALDQEALDKWLEEHVEER